MEALAARCTHGTKVLVIEREKDLVVRVGLQLDLSIGSVTRAVRQVLAAIADLNDGIPEVGEEDFLGRMNALIGELHAQQEMRELPNPLGRLGGVSTGSSL